MMSDFFYRTEDIGPKDVINYFVETEEDRAVIEQLKGKNPTIVIGSRGVGKSFLMRVAEQELLAGYEKNRVLPVYLTFVSGSLLGSRPIDFRLLA
jgi:chromosomal replication initiation ATPase DnaA